MAFHPDCEERRSESGEESLTHGRQPSAASRAKRTAEQHALAARLEETVWRHYRAELAQPGDDGAE
jgi:hypothetical protein